MADFISGLLGMGDEDPMQRAKNAGLLGLGASLLQAGAPSLTPQSLGAALGQGVMAGQQMSGQAMQQARQQQIQQEMMGTMSGAQGGDTAARIAQLQKMALLDPKNQAAYLKIAEQLQGKAPTFTGEVSNAAMALFGTNDVSKLTPEQRQQAVAAAEQSRNRTAKAGAAAAPVVNVKYGEGFGTKLAGAQVEMIANSQASAQGAADTLATVSSMLPVVDEAFTGPGSTIQVALARIGQKIGVGGANQSETLQNTAQLIKGAAQLELDAAAKMRGQGAITENERKILQRAASVDPTELTQAEIKQVLNIIQKSSTTRISQHNSLLGRFIETQPEMERQLQLYRVAPPVPVRRVQ
jgi:hypothetical protein